MNISIVLFTYSHPNEKESFSNRLVNVTWSLGFPTFVGASTSATLEAFGLIADVIWMNDLKGRTSVEDAPIITCIVTVMYAGCWLLMMLFNSSARDLGFLWTMSVSYGAYSRTSGLLFPKSSILIQLPMVFISILLVSGASLLFNRFPYFDALRVGCPAVFVAFFAGFEYEGRRRLQELRPQEIEEEELQEIPTNDQVIPPVLAPAPAPAMNFGVENEGFDDGAED
ncbi:unnamed protein product [Caenorhabditis brenneri]